MTALTPEQRGRANALIVAVCHELRVNGHNIDGRVDGMMEQAIAPAIDVALLATAEPGEAGLRAALQSAHEMYQGHPGEDIDKCPQCKDVMEVAALRAPVADAGLDAALDRARATVEDYAATHPDKPYPRFDRLVEAVRLAVTPTEPPDDLRAEHVGDQWFVHVGTHEGRGPTLAAAALEASERAMGVAGKDGYVRIKRGVADAGLDAKADVMEGWAVDPTLKPASPWLSLSVALAILRRTHPALASWREAVIERRDDIMAAEPARPSLPSDPDPNAVKVGKGVYLHHGLYLRGAPAEPPDDLRPYIDQLDAVEAPAWRCDWKPDELNPGPECPYCAGRMCARLDGLGCTHDRIERHGYADA